MPTIYLTDGDAMKRENVFVKQTGWVVGYNLEESGENGFGGSVRPGKVDHINIPPHRVESIKGEVTHASNPGSDRVRTV